MNAPAGTALVETVFNVPTISGQVAGTNKISLTATLSSASPETVGLMNDARNYVDQKTNDIASFYNQLSLFNLAISSTDDMFMDANGDERYTWSAMEAFANGHNYEGMQVSIADNADNISTANALLQSQGNRITTTENSNQLQNVRITDLESALTSFVIDLDAYDTYLQSQSNRTGLIEQNITSITTDVTGLFEFRNDYITRIDNIEDTYSDQNVLINALQVGVTNHEQRLVIVEELTDASAIQARFDSNDIAQAEQDVRLDDIELAMSSASSTEGLEAELNQEITDREQGDSNLGVILSDEIAARESAITAEASARDIAIAAEAQARDDAVANEASIRASAISTEAASRAAAIQVETEARIEDVADIDAEITNQAALRASADATIQGNLDTEISDRIAADNALSEAISDQITSDIAEETNARETADSFMQGNIDAEILERSNADIELSNDIASKVSLTGDQSIAGHKTFTGDITVDGTTILNDAIVKSSGELDVGDAIVLLNANETGTPSVDAGIEIERGTSDNVRMLWDESADAFASQIGSAAPKKFVLTDDPRLGESFSSDGGTITGALNIIPETANPRLQFGVGTDYSQANVQYVAAQQALGITLSDAGSAGTSTTLILNDAGVTANKPFFGVDSINTSSMTTKGYVDGKFLPFTGGELSGSINIKNADAAATVVLDTTAETGNSQILFRDDSVQNGFIQSTPTRLLLNRDADTNNQFSLYDTYAQFSKEVRGVDSTNAASLTTRSFVMGLDAENVKETGTQTIAGDKTFTGNFVIQNSSFAYARVRTASLTEASHVEFSNNNVRSGLVYRTAVSEGVEDTGALRIRRYNTKDNAEFSEIALGANTIIASKPFIVPSSVNAESATTRGYVDDTFWRLDAQLEINAPANTEKSLFFREIDDTYGRLTLASDNSMLGLRYIVDGIAAPGSQVELRNNRIDFLLEDDVGLKLHTEQSGKLTKFSVQCKGTDISQYRSELELFNGTSRAMRITPSYNMSESYTLVMPEGAPSAGQALRCSSINGQLRYMEWYTP